MTIKQILEKLDPTDRAALMNAFEEGTTYYVVLADNQFVGVNTDVCPHLNCEQQAGDFRSGTIIRGDQDGTAGEDESN